MKRNFLNLLLFAAAGAAFTSCDEHIANESAVQSSASNYFELDGTSKNAAAGIFQFDTTPEKSSEAGTSYYRHELGFLTNAFSFGYDETEGLILSGEGSSVWMELNSKTSDLEPGTYTFTGTQEGAAPFDFGYGAAELDGNNYTFNSGTVTVSRTDKVYTIQFEGQASMAGSKGSIPVKGFYSGNLKAFEDK